MLSQMAQERAEEELVERRMESMGIIPRALTCFSRKTRCPLEQGLVFKHLNLRGESIPNLAAQSKFSEQRVAELMRFATCRDVIYNMVMSRMVAATTAMYALRLKTDEGEAAYFLGRAYEWGLQKGTLAPRNVPQPRATIVHLQEVLAAGVRVRRSDRENCGFAGGVFSAVARQELERRLATGRGGRSERESIGFAEAGCETRRFSVSRDELFAILQEKMAGQGVRGATMMVRGESLEIVRCVPVFKSGYGADRLLDTVDFEFQVAEAQAQVA